MDDTTLPQTAVPAGNRQQLVLVIDDEEPVREAISDILDMEGIAVITAVNGAAGIELYRQRAADVDLIILDLSMPGLSGEETFQELCRVNPDVKVILSSGYSEAEVSSRFHNRQIVDFIQKPYDLMAFVEKIRQQL